MASHKCGADADAFAFSTDGGCTSQSRTPPFCNIDQERSCVSPPMRSSTRSTSRATFRIFVSCSRSVRPPRVAQHFRFLVDAVANTWRAFPFPQLHGNVANAAAAAVNQDALAGHQLALHRTMLAARSAPPRYGRRGDVMK